MEAELQKFLNENETVLWSGTPEAFDTLDKTHKFIYLLKTGIAALLAAAFLVFYISYAMSHEVPIKLSAIAVVIGLIVVIAWQDLSDARKLKRKVLYALTDSRMIIVNGNEVVEAEYDKIDCYTFSEDADGHISLICGDQAMGEKPNTRRFSTLRGVRFDGDKISGFVMYALPEVDKVKKIVTKYVAA